MINDTSTLALNVISSVAFENHEANKPAAGHTLSLRESLVTVMSTSISPALEGIMPWMKWTGLQILLPAQVKKLHLAMAEFRQYMDETVIRERRKTASSDGDNAKVANLISTLIRANDAAKSEDVQSKARLSDVELRGNIFIFTVGGLESTAITLSYTLALLAVHPEVQDWVYEELVGVFRGEEVEYTKVFPRLKRVMAVMVSEFYNVISDWILHKYPDLFILFHHILKLPIGMGIFAKLQNSTRNIIFPFVTCSTGLIYYLPNIIRPNFSSYQLHLTTSILQPTS